MEGDEQGLTSQRYGEIFEQLCPYYLSIGMTYEQFWYGDVSMAKAYREADELRERKRNFELWLQGSYIYEALCDASPLFRFTMKKGSVKPEPYVKEPYPITVAEVRERKEREARQKEERIKANFTAFAERMKEKMSQETHPD